MPAVHPYSMQTLKKSLVLCQLLMGVSAALAQNTPAPAPAPTPVPAPAAETSIPGATKPGKVATAAAKPAVATPAPAVAASTVAASTAAAAKPAAAPAKPEENKKTVAPPAKAETANAAPANGKKEVTAQKKPEVQTNCYVAEFRAIAMETRDGDQRRAKVLDWLKQKGKSCTADKLLAIRNNRSQWMGQADSTVIAGAVDALLEPYAEGNPGVLNYLYGTQPPAPKPPEDKKEAKPK